MSDTTKTDSTFKNQNFLRTLKDLINLRADTDKKSTEDLIRSNIDFRSANAWTLVFAIFIASIGLNVNSPAVIIGAMLISPLMGPIVGAGFALGTYDFDLLKKSSKNLFAAVIISLITSTLYFLLSPISDVQSELLSRTRPSFYDVLIAFFGGAAGIVALSRKTKGNAIPGVAIATALMPPLCTAGFGLASRNWAYFFGAMYLFIINSVFISISTLIIIRYLRFHESNSLEPSKQKYIDRWVTYVGAIVLLPSFAMAWYLHRESRFKSQANKFITTELRSQNLFVIDQQINFGLKNPNIKISLLGSPISAQDINTIKSRAAQYSIRPEIIEIHQSTLSENIEKKINEKLSAAQDQTSQLQLQLKKFELNINEYRMMFELSKKVGNELSVIFPKKIGNVYIIKLAERDSEPSQEGFLKNRVLILVNWILNPTRSEKIKALNFVSERLEVDPSQITHIKQF